MSARNRAMQLGTDLVAPASAPGDAVLARDGMIRPFVILGGGFFVAATMAYVLTMSWTTPVPRDGTTLVMGRDFLNFWMYGKAAVSPDPSAFYDIRVYQTALAAFLADGYPGQSWSYPPSIMLIAAPFGQIGYLPALLCWTVIGLTGFIAAIRRTIPDRRILIALLCSPAAMLCVISGQFALIATAMFATIFAVMDRRPVLAGILIGLLTLKPQLGLFFPVLLLASGRWTVFSAAAATAIVVVTITAALFGPQVWID